MRIRTVIYQILGAVTAMPLPTPSTFSDLEWYRSEIAFLANLKGHVTATRNHDLLIDHIQCELELLGLKVETDVLEFTYNDQVGAPLLEIEGKEVDVSSYAPYSGNTPPQGVTGRLVDLTGSGVNDVDWTKAAGSIAVLNITSGQVDFEEIFALWPGQPAWYVATAIPPTVADAKVANLTEAAEAGVKGVVYAWEGVTTGNAYGQYTPFKRLYQGVPTVYVAGEAATTVRAAARRQATATLTLEGKLVPNTTTRTIYVVIPGTTTPIESVILNTHTDGTNAVEENGHIALLARARQLVANPPRRTTVLVFVTGHMHQPAFSTRGRATRRWLDSHPELWAGGGGMTAVASACVEHLGAREWAEDLLADKYFATGNLCDEVIYANTPETVALLEKHWNGARPGFLRVNNPFPKGVQIGEGEPLTDVGIPNVALITTPLYLVAELPPEFDERTLVDLPALKRQVDSFMAIWDDMDTLPSDAFGQVPPLKRR